MVINPIPQSVAVNSLLLTRLAAATITTTTTTSSTPTTYLPILLTQRPSVWHALKKGSLHRCESCSIFGFVSGLGAAASFCLGRLLDLWKWGEINGGSYITWTGWMPKAPKRSNRCLSDFNTNTRWRWADHTQSQSSCEFGRPLSLWTIYQETWIAKESCSMFLSTQFNSHLFQTTHKVRMSWFSSIRFDFLRICRRTIINSWNHFEFGCGCAVFPDPQKPRNHASRVGVNFEFPHGSH